MRQLPIIENVTNARTGMGEAVLHEVLAGLNLFLQQGETRAIDLRGLPLTAADRDELDAYLGRGEVEVTLNVAGRSVAWETGYPGVWRVQHHDESGLPVAETIEITRIPELLLSPLEDVANAKQRLERDLSAHLSAPELS